MSIRTRLVFTVTIGCLAAVAARAQPAAMDLDSGWRLQDAAKVPAGGEAISRVSFAPAGWFKAAVPGTVLTSLVDDGVYPEPLYGENNRPDRIPDSLCRTSYWYRASFMVPAAFAGRLVWLDFEGINYRAEVWVDGAKAGEIAGAFARGDFDITPWVTPGRPAAVAVHVFPPPHPGVPHEKTIATGAGRNGGISSLDGPTFLCTIGWDWIPGIRDRDTGIWQKVSLRATGPVLVRDPYVVSRLPLPRTDSADLTVEVTLRNATPGEQAGALIGSGGGIFFRRGLVLRPGETRVVTLTPAEVPALRVERPRLWWPNGFGPQNLYTLNLRFETRDGVADARDVTFGIRQIGYSVPGSDNLTLSVNGVPIMVKGGDWGMDEAMKRNPRSRLEAEIRMHRLAHYTMIRNWVGQSTSEDFYELCDRDGLLVWDEFFQPNPHDGPDPADIGLYLANVREKILRFRSHPSIALWCARNEGLPPPALDLPLRRMLAELDPVRLYQPSSTSGRGVNSGGPYRYQPPRDYYLVHEAFKTEIGSVSVPTLEAIHAMMPRRDWETIDDDWAEHDLGAGNGGGDRYPGILAARFGAPINLPDFVRKAQLANYEAFRAMYEGRDRRLFDPCTGVLTWMSNPAQPSFMWQIYSHDLEPNASFFAVRKACEPVHIQLDEDDGHVTVVNNLPAPLENARAQVFLYNLDGTLQAARDLPCRVPGSRAADLGPIGRPPALSPVHFVVLRLRDALGGLVSDNFYWEASPPNPDDFRDLNRLPRVALEGTIVRRDAGGECRLAVSLFNPTRSVALMAHLQLRRRTDGRRVLPVYYDDNYVSLLPGESRTIRIEAAESELKGDAPLVVLDGWNTTVRPRFFPGGGGAALAPNAEAIVDPGALPTFRVPLHSG